MKIDDAKLNNYQKIISKNHKKIKNQADEITKLQNTLNIHNRIVEKQIYEIKRLNDLLDDKNEKFVSETEKITKRYESQLKVQDFELDRRLTIIHYLEGRLRNEIQSHNSNR